MICAAASPASASSSRPVTKTMRRSKSFSCSQPGVGVMTGRYIERGSAAMQPRAGNVATLCKSRGRKEPLTISEGHLSRVRGLAGARKCPTSHRREAQDD